MEELRYIVVIDGKPKGPFSFSQLQTLDIKPSTFLKTMEMDDYKEAHEIDELRNLLGFKFQPTAPQYFAAFDQRVVADIIDYLVVLSVYLLLMVVVYLVTELMAFRIIAIVGLFFLWTARLIYGSFAEASAKQATVGKRLMDLKVTDLNGNKLTLANSFARNIAKIISNFTLGIGYLYLFLNKKQQCLHDVIASTVVVKQRLL